MDPVSFHPDTTERFFKRLEGSPDATDGELSAVNMQRLQECFGAIARGDFEAVAALTAEEVEMELSGPSLLPIFGQWKGRHEVNAAARANYAALAEQKAELLAMSAYGDHIVVIGREQGRVRATEAVYDVHWSQQFTFRDGLIVRIRGVCAAAG